MRNESRVLTVENANYDAVTLNNDHRHINEQPTNPIDDGQNMQKLLFLCRRCHEIFQHFFSSSQDRAAGHLAADRATCLLRKNSTFVLTCWNNMKDRWSIFDMQKVTGRIRSVTSFSIYSSEHANTRRRNKSRSWFLDVRAPVLQIDVHFRQHARSSATREAKAATKIGLRWVDEFGFKT